MHQLKKLAGSETEFLCSSIGGFQWKCSLGLLQLILLIPIKLLIYSNITKKINIICLPTILM